ncbi:uncharacterized protein LOC116298831 [Actinia tenebrosa]|uniref:Uncharacterized protein LOC116298831 n=1 Tax=Actinia tenebrosa TaxID=6105 RepID=A0A6P8IC75_ACTTE|nr:uncharacterized protein LOC116298831 [Actinia tenebrosa]
MGKGLLCHIFSIYKQYFGYENGNLLQVNSNSKLFFDGTDNLPSTYFIKTNSGTTSTFHVIQDGTSYYVNETHDSISLKPDSPGTTFKVKSIARCNPFVSIQSTKSNRYMTTDEDGRLQMQNIEDASKNLKAWFRIGRIDTTDEVDGQPSHGLIHLIPVSDHNNNGSHCFAAMKRSKTFDEMDTAIEELKNKKRMFVREFYLPSWNAVSLVNLYDYMYNLLNNYLSRSR